ncbi:MAG TPA: Na+/H+ antiporter [Gaiellaceae bacterium]|nr:Na+/H+ antiporter [Gaiellaceae bacterium]
MTDLSHNDLVVLLVLLVAGAGMLVLVPKLRIPYPILLVLGGLALGFAPGLPTIDLPPDLVLVGVLPPLLYGAAFFTSLRDLRANVRPVGLLAVGLVLLTIVVVAVVAHAIVPGLPWAAAFVLGAVVSPTDPIAATAIMHRLGAPRRIVNIVEGESLVNDGTALVAYRFAVVAAVSGTFSLWEAGISFVLNVAGGIAVGLGVGWLVRQVRRRLDFPAAEVTISLLTGYFAYIPAELLGVSAVIAAVTVGVYMGWFTPELTTAEVRLMGDSAWEIVTFVLNALLFTLIGLQLPAILDELGGAYSTADLLWWALAVWVTVAVVRALWAYPSAWLPRRLIRRIRERDPMPPTSWLAIITWAGMRGGVSLAAALAIPLTTDAGEPFPNRSLILFLTFAVIFGTLVVQGLTLPALIRLLRLEDEGEQAGRELAQARIGAAEAALARLEELTGEDWVREDTAERVRGSYNFRQNRFAAWLDGEDDGSIESRSLDYQRLRRELLAAEREAVQLLRRAGAISDEVARRVERDLDLEDARLEI